MTVPDSVFGAGITVGAGAAVWAAKSFIRQIAGPRTDRTEGIGGVSVDDYQTALGYAEKVFNGRYLLAKDAAERFDKIETQLHRIHIMLARYVHCECDDCTHKENPHD